MTNSEAMYRSYLMCLWTAGADGGVVWRASLENALTHQRQGFARLDDLFDFLRRQTRGSADQQGVKREDVRGGAPLSEGASVSQPSCTACEQDARRLGTLAKPQEA